MSGKSGSGVITVTQTFSLRTNDAQTKKFVLKQHYFYYEATLHKLMFMLQKHYFYYEATLHKLKVYATTKLILMRRCTN